MLSRKQKWNSVRQGSFVGSHKDLYLNPFLIYINDLQVWEVSSSVLIYADHTSLTLYTNDPTTLRKKKINEDLMRFKSGRLLALIKA